MPCATVELQEAQVRKHANNKIGQSILMGILVAAAMDPSGALAQDANTKTLTIVNPEPSAAAPATATAPAPAQTAAAPKRAASAGGGYFVEFRSRYAQSYGHTFLVHGRIGQRITKKDVAGLHPAGEDPGNWMAGHVIWVPSETGASDGDTEEKYVSARYRVVMNKAQYDRVAAYIRKLQATTPMWHASLYNCNAFVGKVAEFMGLKVPSSSLVYPKVYVTHLRLMNTGYPEADGTLMSDNMKEMNSPTRDGASMRAAGINNTEQKKRTNATVTIGTVRPATGAPR
jgi:hypothetical protein